MECVCVAITSPNNGVFDECISPVIQTFVAVDGGDTFTIGLVAPSGDVVGWGRAFYGELPTKPVEQCQSVACGSNHVLALTVTGQFSPGSEVALPVRITEVAAGGMHSLAIDSCGRVWAWGSNTYGQVGIGSKTEQLCAPRCVMLPLGVRVHHIAAGWAHSALVSTIGEVFTFGWGLYNQLGHGCTQDEPLPVAVDALHGLDSDVVQVACGNWHTAALTASGDMYTWGWGRDGQLGHEHSITTQVLPRVVNVLSSIEASKTAQDVTAIACGSRLTIAVLQDGSVQWWGLRSAKGISPSIITRQKSALHRGGYVPQDGRRVCKVAAGNLHAILLLENREHEEIEQILTTRNNGMLY
uniref:RCC1-like domain-containing protein n=1 Tax=Hyaloperonospora arabidopsidis (strain Emoy2) TaxID=559515 RepID=M4C452_HYAAE